MNIKLMSLLVNYIIDSIEILRDIDIMYYEVISLSYYGYKLHIKLQYFYLF